jgi:hypothetical protein
MDMGLKFEKIGFPGIFTSSFPSLPLLPQFDYFPQKFMYWQLNSQIHILLVFGGGTCGRQLGLEKNRCWALVMTLLAL